MYVQVPIFKLNHLSNPLHGALLVIVVLLLLGGNSTRAYKTLLEALKIPGQSLFVIQRMLILLFVFLLKLEINMAFCLFVPFCILVISSQDCILLVGCSRVESKHQRPPHAELGKGCA